MPENPDRKASAQSLPDERNNPPPPGWGIDTLSSFLHSTHQSQYATFHNKKEAFGRLAAIDALFGTASKDWLNPSNEVVALLFLRCHAACRGSGGRSSC